MEPQPYSLRDYIEIAKRRKWWIVIPFVVCLGLSYGYYKRLPKIYNATTLILVQPQEVPEDYIKPTVKSLVSDRLSTLSQQILSRTRLEKVIREFSLYPNSIGKVTMEEIIELMREAVTIEVQRTRGRDVQNTFTISYEGRDPRKVMLVTNRLALLFIEENLRARERQAVGTSDFIERELSAIEVTLKEKEKDIRGFKERHMGELPGQLDANLRILERLQDQINNNSDARKAAEERRIMLQGQISQLSKQGMSVISGEVVVEDPLMTQLSQLKARLSELQSMYTDRHPDVIDTKVQIAKLEKDIVQQGDISKRENSGVIPAILNPSIARLKGELTEAQLEISRLKVEGESLRNQIAMYERRVENAPKREQELTILTRDYDLLKANYQSLLDKRIQAKMAENLERRQMGEQFKVLDPARMPEKPFKPDPRKIMLIGAFMGLVLGGGLGYMKESMDRSFHNVEEIERFLGLPVIAAIPVIEKETAKAA
jgi:polysaccharide chain length determinant protein (PEP-CTERM system associated)